jgi:hypothetical protein
MLDYINQTPMTLKVKIHVKDCPDKNIYCII